ncbi:MAG TPA: hypothetical protein VF624_16175 [Tepidisphaeraceae bacterium]|jgi:hypothetical protein
MNKVLEYFEAYCQWIAVGIGALFLLWALYSYVLVPPVTVQAGNQQYSPGNVDLKVEQSARRLKEQLEDTTPVDPPKNPNTPVAGFLDAMNGANLTAIALRPDWASGTPGVIVKEDDGGGGDSKQVIAALPVVTPAVPQAVKPGRAFINPNPVMANGAPVPPAVVPVPGQPAPPAQPGVVAVAGKDLAYVKFDYAIDVEKIDAAFRAVGIGQGINNTSIIAVKLMRREKKPDGTLSDPVEIRRIANGENVFPLPPRPEGQTVKDILNWGENPLTLSALVRPAFFQVFAGEGPFDPPAVLPIDQVDAVEQQRKDKMIEDRRLKAEADKAAREQRRSSRPPPGAGGAGPGDEGMGGPDGGPPRGPRGPRGRGNLTEDPQRGANVLDGSGLGGLELAQAPPVPRDVPPFMRPGGPGRPPMPILPGDPDNPMMPGMPGEEFGMPGQPPVQPGQGQSNAEPLPSPVFQPGAIGKTITAWAYDDTVEEGRTYQYQVLYALRNPVFAANANVAVPDVAGTFALWSILDEGAWSQDVTVDPSTYFFLAQPNWQMQSVPGAVRMSVYKWAAGKWQVALAPTVAPGDVIGAVTGNTSGPVSFATNYTLVDVRYDERQQRPYVIVLGPDGKLTEREPKADRDDKVHAALRMVIEQGNAANGAAAGMPFNPNGMAER